jgi:hypothetical protein
VKKGLVDNSSYYESTCALDDKFEKAFETNSRWRIRAPGTPLQPGTHKVPLLGRELTHQAMEFMDLLRD